MRSLIALAALLLPSSTMAASISATGYPGGPDSGAATPNVGAIHYNPAAIAATEGVQVMIATTESTPTPASPTPSPRHGSPCLWP
jgi:hypothetical protein